MVTTTLQGQVAMRTGVVTLHPLCSATFVLWDPSLMTSLPSPPDFWVLPVLRFFPCVAIVYGALKMC